MALQDPAPVALPFHTFVLASFFILLALAGARMNSQLPQQHTDASLLYISLIAGQWGLLYYVSKAHSVSDLIGGRGQSWVDVVADVGVAIVQWAAFWGASWLFVRAWIRFIGRGHAASVRNLLPVRAHEIALWILLSISAGIIMAACGLRLAASGDLFSRTPQAASRKPSNAATDIIGGLF